MRGFHFPQTILWGLLPLACLLGRQSNGISPLNSARIDTRSCAAGLTSMPDILTREQVVAWVEKKKSLPVDWQILRKSEWNQRIGEIQAEVESKQNQTPGRGTLSVDGALLLMARAMYRDLWKNLGSENFLFHGTSSIALRAFLRDGDHPETGLLPTGQLMEKYGIPFSGEMMNGAMEGGINDIGISVTGKYYFDRSLAYALPNSWSPEQARLLVAKYERDLEDYKPEIRRNSNGRLVRNLSDLHHFNLHVERERLAGWEKLPAIEKDLIKNSFPVLIGFEPQDHHFIFNSIRPRALTDEQAYIGSVGRSQLRVLLVPRDKVKYVRDLLNLPGVEIHPIEPYKEILDRYDFTKHLRDAIDLTFPVDAR